MKPPTCARHPGVTSVAGQCPACLLECGLASSDVAQSSGIARFTLQVPLGRSDTSSVFLARGEWPAARLLRFKRWHTPAPSDFLRRFERLQKALQTWSHPAVVQPLAAWVDGDGCPAVLTDFRVGVPLVDAVSAGWLSLSSARECIRQVGDVLGAAHAVRLAHGSVRAGNVFVDRATTSPFLLDFGLAPTLARNDLEGSWESGDRAGLLQLTRLVEGKGTSDDGRGGP